MCLLKKLTKLNLVVIMIKDYRLLLKLRHIHVMQMLEKYAKENCYSI